jgi:hypothetical protein
MLKDVEVLQVVVVLSARGKPKHFQDIETVTVPDMASAY